MVLDYIPCNKKHIVDIMEISLNITDTPYDEWEDIFMELIDNSVCKYKYLKGRNRNKYCMKKVKNKNNLFLYGGKEIPLCHTHKFQLLNPKYSLKGISLKKEGSINKIRYKTTIEDIFDENESLYEKINCKDLTLLNNLYKELTIIDKYSKNGYIEKCKKNNKKEIKLICYNNIYLEQEINKLNSIEYNNDHYNIEFINIRFNSNLCLNINYNKTFICNNYITRDEDYCDICLRNILKEDDSFIEENISEIVESLEIKNTNSIIRKNNLKNIDNYLCDNRIRKKRKLNYSHNKNLEPFDPCLKYNFSFNYSVKDYYIRNINRNNRKLLNKILEYIIDIRNCIHNDHYAHNKTYTNILHISNKILDII